MSERSRAREANLAGAMIRTLDEWASKEQLAASGIAVPLQRLVTTPEEAVQAAEDIGYPVVLKRANELHKSDAGGVRLCLNTSEEVSQAWGEMSEGAVEAVGAALAATPVTAPQSTVSPRFNLQKSLPAGAEMLVAVRRDPQFGLSLLLGRGGTEAEAWQDTAYRLWPMSPHDVLDQLRSLRTCRPWVETWRGKEPRIDIVALWGLLQQLADLFAANPLLVEVELNPVLFWGVGKGLGIADARLSEYVSNPPSALENNAQGWAVASTDSAIDHAEGGSTDGAMNGDAVSSANNPAVRRTGPANPAALPRPSLELIQTLFHPKRIAIVGATPERAKLGGRLTRYVTAHRFPGEIAYVNPNYSGQPGWYASLSDVPDPVDVALVAVPSHRVPQVLAECRTCRVPAAIVYASGFAETGDAGRRKQQELLDAAGGEVRIVGPNTMGIVSQTNDSYLAFGMTLEMQNPPKGNIAVVSQSGALSSSLVGRLWESGIGCSRWITTGNEADLTISDFLPALIDDDATSVIGLFIESIRDIPGFEAAARRALELGKPIVALKPGRTQQARQAIESHTGSLAGEDALYEDFFRRLGVLRPQDFAGFSNALRVLSQYRGMGGRRIGVVSTSGGANSLVADEMARLGLELPAFSETTAARLGELIADFGAAHNPVDVTLQLTVHPETFGPVVQAITDDPSVDALLVVLTTNSDPPAAVMAEALTLQMRTLDKPVVVVRMGPAAIAPKALSVYRQCGISVFTTPEQGVSCLAALAAYAEFRKRGVVL